MRPPAKLGRSGMTVVELIVGMLVAGFLLAGLTGVFISQTRLFGEWESRRTARDVVRSATQILAADLRRLESTGGIEAASDTAITLRVPFSMGLVCASTAVSTTLSVLPTDSVMLASAAISGQAWRTATGYGYANVTSTSAGASGTCTGVNITTLPSGRVVTVMPGAGPTVKAGTAIFLYQRVLYRFEDGTDGSILTRRLLTSGATDNLVRTFVPEGTRFRFFVDGSDVAQDAPPADLTTLRGFELAMEGKGAYGQPGQEEMSMQLAEAVFFRNPPN